MADKTDVKIAELEGKIEQLGQVVGEMQKQLLRVVDLLPKAAAPEQPAAVPAAAAAVGDEG